MTHMYPPPHMTHMTHVYIYKQIPDPATVERRALLTNQIFELWHVGEQSDAESAGEKPPIGADMAALNGCHHEVRVKKKMAPIGADMAALKGCLDGVRVCGCTCIVDACIYVCVFVSMFVCVCIYVCVYVSMFVCMHLFLYVCICGCVYV